MKPLLTPEQIAQYFGISEGTLANWRSRGVGPAFLKVGKAVKYREEDVSAWLEDNTKEPGHGHKDSGGQGHYRFNVAGHTWQGNTGLVATARNRSAARLAKARPDPLWNLEDGLLFFFPPEENRLQHAAAYLIRFYALAAVVNECFPVVGGERELAREAILDEFDTRTLFVEFHQNLEAYFARNASFHKTEGPRDQYTLPIF
jgi:excisionase family DNA binding protein